MVNLNRFYTYAYLRENRTPYYIGKGTEKRIFEKRRRYCKPPKDKSRIIYLKQNLTEEEAFKHEKYMIAVFGRKDLGTGILHNRTNGGEGLSGFTHSEESKRKQSEKMKGKNSPNYGKHLTEETRRKISEANTGKSHTEETKIKLSLINSGENNPNYGKRGKDAPFYGKSHTEEFKKRHSGRMKGENNPMYGKSGESNPRYGKSHTEESKRKIGEANRGEKNAAYGKKWYNNGEIEKMNLECPEGWVKGRLKRTL